MLLVLLFLLLDLKLCFSQDHKKGFVIGSFLGEAYGGPREFRPRKPLKLPASPSPEDWRSYAQSLSLETYAFPPSDYGHWDSQGRRGSLTDETRHKIIYLNAKKNRRALAEAYISYSKRDRRWEHWLREYVKAAYWVTGERDLSIALPLERLWGGMSTQAGQMVFLFEALNHVNDPVRGYLKVWELNWIDQAQAKDNTSAVVALSSLLIAHQDFYRALKEVKLVDPFRFNSVLYVPRRVGQLIDQALELSKAARGNPHTLFELFERNLKAVTWWEDHVPFVISLALIDFIGIKEPLAALRLAIDFGHDTDSVAHLLGAWLGAIHSEQIFSTRDAEVVDRLMREEYGHVMSDFL